jgi:hypothetical protein
VLSQLGNRVQHALRAFTPRDAKALKAAVTTYPKTDDYDLEEDLTQLGTGEAVVTILSERGAPTPVVWTRLCPPGSLMDTIGEEAMAAAARADPLSATYGRTAERRTASDVLAARRPGTAPPEDEPVDVADVADEDLAPSPGRRRSTTRRARRRAEPPPRRSGRDDESPIVRYAKSREGRAMANTVVRGVFSFLKKRR